MTGAVGQRRVPTLYLAEQSMPLPPAKEQHRIVAKIDKLFSVIEAGIDSLKAARVQLATYRKAVLKHAFEGKLTAPWRELNGSLPGAKTLLHQILSERRNALENAQLRRQDAKVRARATSGRLACREPATSWSTALPAIRSWCWATVDQRLADELSNGRSVKSAQNGFPVLRLTALRNGEIEQDECKIGAWTDQAHHSPYSPRMPPAWPCIAVFIVLSVTA